MNKPQTAVEASNDVALAYRYLGAEGYLTHFRTPPRQMTSWLPREVWATEIWAKLFAGSVLRCALSCSQLWTAYQRHCRILVLLSHSFECWTFRDDHVPRLPRGLLHFDAGCCSLLTDACVPHMPPALAYLAVGPSIGVTNGCIPHLPRLLTFMNPEFMGQVYRGSAGLPPGIEWLAKPTLRPNFYIYSFAHRCDESGCSHPRGSVDRSGCDFTPACIAHKQPRPQHFCRYSRVVGAGAP